MRIAFALMHDLPDKRRERNDVEHLVHQRIRHLAERRDNTPPAREIPVPQIRQARQEHHHAGNGRQRKTAAELLHDGTRQPREDQRDTRKGEGVDNEPMNVHESDNPSAMTSCMTPSVSCSCVSRAFSD